MATQLLICRPQPGADATAEKAAAMGLASSVYPLFRIEPVEWTPAASGQYDAIMLTSANAARHGGEGLSLYRHLPVFTVGEATAQAAKNAGFQNVIMTNTDGQALIDHICSTKYKNILHPCGEHVRPYDTAGLHIQRHIVYHAAATGNAKGVADALNTAHIALVHSPRAGERLYALTTEQQRATCTLIAISKTARIASGGGWRRSLASETARDSSMLAIALQICNIDTE